MIIAYWRSQAPPGGLHIDEIIERLGGACPLTGPFAEAGAVRRLQVGNMIDPFYSVLASIDRKYSE